MENKQKQAGRFLRKACREAKEAGGSVSAFVPP